MEQKTLQYLFNNIKDSDWIMFYHSKWYYLFSKVIFLATRKKIDHVGVVFNVRREEKLVVFDFYEYKASDDKCVKSVNAIFKDEHGNCYLNGYTADNLYYSNYISYPSDWEIKIGKDYADKEVDSNKKYGFPNLVLSLDYVFNILPKKVRPNPLKSKIFCSQFAYLCDYVIGKLTKDVYRKDKWVSPAELTELKYRNFYTIIDYKKS